MIITRTPFRVSFFGGGTDYPTWYREHGGAVLATTIDKYCYISCRRLPQFFDHKHRIVYSTIENVKNIDEIQHPAVRTVLNWGKVTEGLEIHHDGDLPARSGLGSSSSFTAGLVHALHALNERTVSKKTLAQEVIHIEQNILAENVGSQDQISAVYGGFNRIDFHCNDTFDVSPLIMPQKRFDELSSHLMLFFTGISRFATEVAKSKIENFKNREKELKSIREMVDEAISILQVEHRSLDEFGQLLHESWLFKRSLSDKISNSEIDGMYEAALQAGAIGGKLLGAGGGGFLLIFAKPEQHSAIRTTLSHLVHVPFKFDNSGSRVVLYQPYGL